MLNGNPIGGKRRGSHYSDLWCMKYLPKFKWDNLTEEIEYQKALRFVFALVPIRPRSRCERRFLRTL
jgi:hypothetical protein